MKTSNLREKTIKDYDKIVKFVLKNMKLGHRYDELYDVGLIGFTRGLNTYDETKGFTYMTYLYDCIQREIAKHLKYENCKKRKADVVSLNMLIKDKNNNVISELQDLIGYEIDYEQNAYIDELINIIQKRSVDFTKKQWIIFNHLYGMNGYKELTTAEISKKYGFSKQSVYQIKEKILRMLRYTLNNYQDKDGLYTKKTY